MIVEVMIDPKFATQPRVISKSVNGKLISGKLEDMWPFKGD